MSKAILGHPQEALQVSMETNKSFCYGRTRVYQRIRVNTGIIYEIALNYKQLKIKEEKVSFNLGAGGQGT